MHGASAEQRPAIDDVVFGFSENAVDQQEFVRRPRDRSVEHHCRHGLAVIEKSHMRRECVADVARQSGIVHGDAELEMQPGKGFPPAFTSEYQRLRLRKSHNPVEGDGDRRARLQRRLAVPRRSRVLAS